MDTVEEKQISGLTIRIERDLCAATENCIKVAPEVFELGEDQIVSFQEDTHDIEPERLIEACAVCRAGTRFAFDKRGQQQVP